MAQFLLVINKVLQLQYLFTKKSAGVSRQLCGKEDGRESVLAVLIFHLSGPDSAKHLTTCLILGTWVIPSLWSKACVSFSLILMGLLIDLSNIACSAWHSHNWFHLAEPSNMAFGLSLCKAAKLLLLCNSWVLWLCSTWRCSASCVWHVGKWTGSKWEPSLFRTFPDQYQPHFVIQLWNHAQRLYWVRF